MYLKWIFKNKEVVELPCYTSPRVQHNFRKKILQNCKFGGNIGIVKIFAPLTENPNIPNTPDEDGITPIHWATIKQYTKIVNILAHLSDDPNSPDKNGKTPIHEAASRGNSKIVKILAPLTNNPNTPDKNGITPIHLATEEGHTGIVKILAEPL